MLGYTRYEIGAGQLNTYAAVRKAAFNTPFGEFRESFISSDMSISREQVASFSGQVAPGASYTFNITVPEDAVFSTVQLSWTNRLLTGNNLRLGLERGGRVIESNPAWGIAWPGFQRTVLVVNEPEAGQWTITVTNTGSLLTGSVQSFAGAVETFKASLGRIRDLDVLASEERRSAVRALRSGLLDASQSRFDPNRVATRIEAARAVMLGAGARVPQYLPYSPTYLDVQNGADAIFVESCARSPRGNLFAATGTHFNPQGQLDRLTLAVALSKTAASEQEAQSAGLSNPGLDDWGSIPGWARGYVAIALSRGLMTARSGGFRPFDYVTRVELAGSAVALQQATR
jgi:hypothetical protein